MSLLTPERVPVKVYKWDDASAPALDKTAGCMATIFKACLVSGYGTQQGAGWTMPWEDTAAGVKVFRSGASPDTDFYLRCSGDSGTEMAAQVYLNMTNANTGDLKLQCATPFKYAKKNSTGKWLLIACPRGFWFFCEQSYSGAANQTGAYFYCGKTTTSLSSDSLTYLQHTGGGYDDGDFSSIMGFNDYKVDKGETRYLFAKAVLSSGLVVTCEPASFTDGGLSIADDNIAAPLIVIADRKTYTLPGAYVPFSVVHNNFEAVNILNDSVTDGINFGTNGRSQTNLYIATDEWVF